MFTSFWLLWMQVLLLHLHVTNFKRLVTLNLVGLVEAFGRFTRLLKPGINLINPCSEDVRQVDLRLRGLGAGRHPTITKDQVKVDIEASLTFRVTNPVISYYVLGNNLNRALM
jgi:regulator of protease activity HflC (stomatin/prohibitin superfamily)